MFFMFFLFVFCIYDNSVYCYIHGYILLETVLLKYTYTMYMYFYFHLLEVMNLVSLLRVIIERITKSTKCQHKLKKMSTELKRKCQFELK